VCPRTMILRTLWLACAVFVPLVVITTVVVEAVPHVRGIGFVLQLRYALMTPACAVSAIGATILYQFLKGRSDRPRWMWSVWLAAIAAIVLLLIGILASPGLAWAVAPAVLGVAIALALLVPRFVERPRSRVGTVAIVIFGTLEVVGVVAALASERVAPPGRDGMAFDIPRALFDADHKFVDLPTGARVHYVDEGTGDTLLFLHGNPSWSFQWRDLVHGLRGSHRCIALDYPGFGLSQAPARFGFTAREESRVVEEFVDRLGLRDLTLIMQDWGGPIGIDFAERHPEVVRRVVLGSTWAWPTSRSEPRGLWSVIAGGPVGEFAQVNFNGIASFGIRSSVVRELPPDVYDVYMRPFRPLNRRGIAAFYPWQITAASAYFAELEAGLSRIVDKPALIFWALEDPGFPRSDLAKWEKAFPNHKTVELPKSNHFFFEDAAPQMVEEISAFASMVSTLTASDRGPQHSVR
jgi:haloalkane dehalogenase